MTRILNVSSCGGGAGGGIEGLIGGVGGVHVLGLVLD